MATLHILYDLDSKRILGANRDGKILPEVSSIVLRNGTLAVHDAKGNDLLGGPPSQITASTVEPNMTQRDVEKAQSDIALALGYDATVEGY